MTDIFLRLKDVLRVRADPATGRVAAETIQEYPAGDLSLILMDDYKAILLVNAAALRSQFVQLFVFERYDARFLEPVILDPSMKVYRFKG